MAGAISLLGPVTGRTEAARPVAWQDPGPFAQPFLQLPFDAPEPVARGVLELSIRTLYSNSIARAQAAGLSVDVSVETAAPMGSVRYGLGRGFEVQLAIPGAIEYPGFLARPIKVVEGLFGSVNPLRAGPTPAAARFRVVRDDTSGIDWSGTDGSAGDPLFEVGSGLLAGWTFGALSLRLATDVMIPERGPFTAAALRTRPHFTVQVGLARRLSSWLTGMLQASAHTSAIAETGIGVMDGTTTYVLAGVAVEPTRHTSVGFGVVENVLHSSRGADISGVLDFAWHP